MSVQTFNRHLLIQEANLLQFVPLLLQHHQVKPFSLSEHPSVSSSKGETWTLLCWDALKLQQSVRFTQATIGK